MMIIDGIEVRTTEELEAAIANFTEESKTSLRNLFYGNPPPPPTQAELDYRKYMKRAAALNIMMAEMASENITRVRTGVWTVNQLISLTQDPQIKEILSDLVSLSFEIAYSKVDAITNPIITSEIKNQWKTKLAANFYN